MNDKARVMLTELAELLEALPPERFDYMRWVGRDWKGDPELSCGTTACAAGWATTLPSFQAAGLRLGLQFSSPTVLVLSSGRVEVGIDAMAAVLGIGGDDAAFLFAPEYDHPNGQVSPSESASAIEVAAHIRGFVASV